MTCIHMGEKGLEVKLNKKVSIVRGRVPGALNNRLEVEEDHLS